MKEFSHPGARDTLPAEVNLALETTIIVARNEWKYVAEVVTELASDLPPVLCLPGEFNQVILNLIVNAALAIGEELAKTQGIKRSLRITTKRDGAWAEI